MKTLYRIFRGIFAIIGIISVGLFIYISVIDKYDGMIKRTDVSYSSARIDSLRSSGPFAVDSNKFEIKIIQDSVRAKEIRDYFQLDTLYPADATTWEKALAIGKFVATNIPHDNQLEWPEDVNAIGLWEYTKTVAPAFNCRLHSILTFELLLSVDIRARYITCLPQDEDDTDCHVVNEVWLPELGKWVMLDTDMGGHYITDEQGNLLSLREIREHYISGEVMITYPGFEKKNAASRWYYAYMAKNTYWFNCWGELSYYQEDYKKEDVVREHFIDLVPSGFVPFGASNINTITTNADQFWAEPNEL